LSRLLRMASALVVLLSLLIGAGGPAQAAPADPINHVVVIYMENHSFDNLYGLFPGANGIARAGRTATQVDKSGAPFATLPQPINTSVRPAAPDARFPADLPNKPFNIDQFVPLNQNTGDLVHRFYQEQIQINGGKMDKFAAISDAAGLSMGNSNAAVSASSVTVNGAATGLLFGTNTGGSFSVNGATSLTNITGTGINAGSATGTYTFKGLTIGYSGNGRGIDLRNSNLQFETDTISITGDGTAGSIGIDLSGTQNPNGANSATPNILLAKDASETASISNVATGVKMGEPGNSAGAYFRFGNQTPLNSGSSIAVLAGGITLDTTNLTSTNGFTQGRYEFAGVVPPLPSCTLELTNEIVGSGSESVIVTLP